MKVAIFTGVINLHRENRDVRKQYIIERLKHFVQDDISLEIITPQIDECLLDLPQGTKYDMYKLINKKHLKVFSATVYPISKLFKLDCKLIHCYTHQAATLTWLINYFKKQKHIIIFEPMGLAYEESKLDKNCSAKVKLLRPFIKYAEKLIFQKSNVIVVYNLFIKEYISQEFNINIKKIYVIPHGVDLNTPSIENKTNSSHIRKELSIPEKDKIILYAGSLSELHGTPYLIEAIDYVTRKRQDISFLILGKGVLENKLKNWVKKNELANVHLLGFVPSEKIGYYLNQANILLIPHAKCMQTELDQPTKLFEYLASGKPIVSFNLKAIAEVVGDNAILAEPNSPESLADGILTLVDDERRCRKLGEKGKTICKGYSWEISAKKQYELYKELHKNIQNKSN